MDAQQIAKMSDAELEKFLDTVPEGTIWRQTAYEELCRRRFRSMAKRHWTTTAAFWVSVIAMILALIAVWPVIREWFRG